MISWGDVLLGILSVSVLIMRLTLINLMGPAWGILGWVFCNIPLFLWYLTSCARSRSFRITNMSILFFAGTCDSLSFLSFVWFQSWNYHLYLLGQTPVISHSLTKMLGDSGGESFPLRVLGFMVGSAGVMLICWKHTENLLWIAIGLVVLDGASNFLKAQYLSRMKSKQIDANPMNLILGGTMILTAFVALWLLPIPSLSNDREQTVQSLTLASPEMGAIFMCSIVPIFINGVASRLKQSTLSPLISFLCCSSVLIALEEHHKWDLAQVIGQLCLVISAGLLCVQDTGRYSRRSTEMNLLSRTTE
jgi:hypothetical protein